MILLPYGHEQTEVRRLPWVTLTLMGLCLAAFLLSGRWHFVPDEDWEIQEDIYAALEYYQQHPYLTLEPGFRDTFLGAVGDDEMLEWIGISAELIPEKPPDEVLEAEQLHLDTITKQTMDAT